MSKAVIPLLVFIVTLAILWQTFYLTPYLDGIGAVSYHKFLKQYISSPLLFTILIRPYLYISLTLFRSIIPISIFFLVGLVMSKYIRSYWLIFAYSVLLTLLNIPKFVLDLATTINSNLSLISVLTFITGSFVLPVYAMFGYSLGKKYLKKSFDSVR
jgi:hypothetical protein